ncbi:hypothetical protein EW145_g5346 [Phellinidium pouzarii]|uniref:Methyltransferase type 11 domain-containing protein n=1 Tax=Phellinidium pouzarii TaxID=167371 RepID=A0A4S4L248_9AGAM|nr:hypothetical protein EW145_g5346 [Phellinidium pouzarii]
MSSPSPSSAKVHPQSHVGFGTGKIGLYDKVRPGYDSAVLSDFRKAVSKEGDLNIVEIGCGSGIFTRALLSHPDWSSSLSSIKCVDPSEAMRAVFAEHTDLTDPRVSLADGTFDETGVSDGWADAIVASTSFNWCLHHEESVKEFARILKPDGVIYLLWNLQDRWNFAWVKQVDTICQPSATYWETEFDKWRNVFTVPSYSTYFQPPEEKTISSTESVTLENFTLHAFTRSAVAILPDEGKEKVREGIRDIVQRGEDLKWTDKEKGLIEVPYSNLIVVFRRKPATQ